MWRDHHGTVAILVCANDYGNFLKVELSPMALKGRKVGLCLPAGKKEGGQRLEVAEHITTSIGKGIQEKLPPSPSKSSAKVGIENQPDKKQIKISLSFVGGEIGGKMTIGACGKMGLPK